MPRRIELISSSHSLFFFSTFYRRKCKKRCGEPIDTELGLVTPWSTEQGAAVSGEELILPFFRFNFLSKDQLTKKKDRILIKDLISNK